MLSCTAIASLLTSNAMAKQVKATSSGGNATLFEPLPAFHIRLLELQGRVEGMLRCTVIPYPIDSAPEYFAISYTCGPAEDPDIVGSEQGSEVFTGTRTTVVNGQRFEIGQNLFNCLEVLEPRDRHVYYWIDALCINQDNDAEKSEQVNRMGDIYYEGRLVLVWLGRAYPSTPRVIEMMEVLAEIWEEVRTYGGLTQYVTTLNDPSDPVQSERFGLKGAIIEDWHAFMSFYRRNWFS